MHCDGTEPPHKQSWPGHVREEQQGSSHGGATKDDLQIDLVRARDVGQAAV